MFIGALFLMAVTPCKFPLVQTIHQQQGYDLQAFLSLQNYTTESIHLALLRQNPHPSVGTDSKLFHFYLCMI